ncbi:MAG: hypothetical protein ABEJ86_00095 [Halococcoides sp.]
MNRTPLLIALVIVVGAAGLLATGSVGAQTATNTTTTENGTIAPGARLAGVLGMQDVEIEGMVERRAYGLQSAAARSNSSKAKVLAKKIQTLEQRIERLEQRKQALERARENDSIDESRYAARMAELSARIETTRELANETNETAAELPEETLRANGVNVTAIKMLKRNAATMTGPQVAAIARTIGGPPGEIGPPAWAGPEDERGEANESERGPPGADERGEANESERGPPGADERGEANESERGPPGEDERGPPETTYDTPTDETTTSENEARA